MLFRSSLRTVGTMACAVALTLAFSVPTAAQIQKPKNAVKSLKSQSQGLVQDAKKSLVNTKVVLGAQLAGFTKAIANGAAYSPDKIESLFTDIEGVQADISEAVQNAVLDMRAVGSQLLTDINGGLVDPSIGIYPENFYRGDQGHLDAFHFNVREIVRKSLKLTRHRMRRLAKNLRKNTTVQVTSVVGPRLAMPALVIGEGVVSPLEEMLMVDLLMAHSDTNFNDDGFLYASGSANATEGPVTVEIYDITGQVVASQLSQLSPQNRWLVTFENMTEGNYQVLATQGVHRALSEIGVR